MSKPGDEFYGNAVVDGEIKFFSVSALERGDIRSGGCLLKYHKRYVQGIKDAGSDRMDAGNVLHAEFEHYFKHPEEPVMLSATALKALSYLPERGPDILAEARLSSPKSPHLFADGVPLIVKIDLIHDRGTNRGGGDDLEQLIDPPGTVEVIDYKWKKDASARTQQFHLQPAELVKSIQMSGYGVCIGNIWPEREHIRLSHLYVPVTGLPKKVTRLHVIDDCRRNWEYVDSVARTLKDVAKETNERNVPGNRHACDKYGGCDHKKTCYAYARNVEQYTTSLLFGQTAAAELKDDMGLMNTLPPNLMQNTLAQQPQALPSVQQMLPQQPNQEALRAQLAAEEAAQRAQAAQQTVGTYPGFAEAWNLIVQIGNTPGGPGVPGLSGQAAQIKGALEGIAVTPGAGLAGTGHLGQYMISDPAQVVQLARELAGSQQPAPVQQAPVQQAAPIQQTHVQHNTPAPMAGFIAPESPPSNPAMAAKPIEGFTLPGQVNTALPMQTNTNTQQTVTATVTLQPSTPAVVTPTEQLKKRGRRSKAQIEADNAAAAAAAAQGGTPVASNVSNTPDNGNNTDQQFDADSVVCINCIPSAEFESLRPYMDQVHDALIKKFNTGAEALKDIRLAPNDSAVGFGKGLAAIRALVTECPPPSGCYYLDTRDSDLARAVADGLETVCNRVGALFVKGI